MAEDFGQHTSWAVENKSMTSLLTCVSAVLLALDEGGGRRGAC